jgi:hypothetical protein
MERAIHDVISGSSEDNEFKIDLSFSELGNAGVDELMPSLSSLRDGLTLDLTSQMNRLTPVGASSVLKRLLGDEGAAKEEKKDGKEEEEASAKEKTPSCKLRSLDLSWNNFSREEVGSKDMLADLRKLVENPSRCPKELRLNCCSLGPAACRSIGKGIINRYKTIEKEGEEPAAPIAHPPLALHLCGNAEVGDAGAAALAAAIRGSKKSENAAIFSTLDLSACSVGDAGAEALALALESRPGCIERLILSNNQISNSGASSIARAIADGKTRIEWLELDNNPGIGSVGGTALADAVGKGTIASLSLRSCEVKADGATAFGECLKALSEQEGISEVSVDLSGNPMGILKKKKKESLKSKASATTASYMNFIGKSIKSGLKDVGLDTMLGSSSVESDDEEEERREDSDDSESADEPIRCGAKAFASAIVLSEDASHRKQQLRSGSSSNVNFKLAMRHCFLDQGAGDALAATIVQAKEQYGVTLEVDVELNNVLEDDMVRALAGSNPDGLDDMLERHLEAVEAICIAEERAAQALAAAAARMRRQQAEWSDDEHPEYHNMGFDDNSDDYGEAYDPY